MVLVVLVVVLVSLWLAARGHSAALILPIACVGLGIVLYLVGEPTPSGGGDGDPMRLTGTGLLVFGAPWTAVVLAARWVSRRTGRRDARSVPRGDRR